MSETRAERLFGFLKIISYFYNNSSQRLYKTKLNKLLFYTQFQFYKFYEKRLLDGDFICDYYGPVYLQLDRYLDELCEHELITLNETLYGTVIDSSVLISKDEYSKRERKVLRKVLDKFDTFTSREISNYSHDESLWTETELKGVIDIERANELSDI